MNTGDSNIGLRPTPNGVGLGLRRDLANFLLANEYALPRFVEFAPENWMGLGGKWGKTLREICERYPVTCHGLSLSVGSPEELDWDLLTRIKNFFSEFPIRLYSEHLSYSKCDNAHLYDLLPIPFREEAVKHVSKRIQQVQDFLGRRIAIENVSYYSPVAPEMDEATFIHSVVTEADCDLLLDVNNVYVNAFNHKYDAHDFLLKLPLDKVVYIHMAGHEQKAPDLIIDTHGQAIIDPVFDLFKWTLNHINPVPVLLERDFNYPDNSELLLELEKLQFIMDSSWVKANAA